MIWIDRVTDKERKKMRDVTKIQRNNYLGIIQQNKNNHLGIGYMWTTKWEGLRAFSFHIYNSMVLGANDN